MLDPVNMLILGSPDTTEKQTSDWPIGERSLLSCFGTRRARAQGAAVLTGNYAGSLGDTSRWKQRIKVSGEEEIKALFYANTCSCPHPLPQTQQVFFSLTLMFLLGVTQSGVRINVMGASLLLWIAKAEILLTHYLTEGITRGFAEKKKKSQKSRSLRRKRKSTRTHW